MEHKEPTPFNLLIYGDNTLQDVTGAQSDLTTVMVWCTEPFRKCVKHSEAAEMKDTLQIFVLPFNLSHCVL